MNTTLHPNDESYQKMMANVFIPAMKKVIIQ